MSNLVVNVIVMPRSRPGSSAPKSTRTKNPLRRFSRIAGLALHNIRPSASAPILHVVGRSRAFPFLRLPRELREMIYEHLRETGSNIIDDRYGRSEYEQFYIQSHALGNPEILSSPNDSGLLAYHGDLPSLPLQLVCRQIHAELFDHFFEIGALTPHADEWRFDPTYARLATSSRLGLISKILVRVELVDLRMMTHLGSIKFVEIGLEACVLKLQNLTEMMVRVLRKGAKDLAVLQIDWKDDFGAEDNWELKKTVLLPLATLKGVKLRVGKVEISRRAKAKAERVLEDTLDGLCAGG